MYSDEDCIDTMRSLILQISEPNSLTGDDFDLLEDYAPKLFNRYDGKDLEKVMYATIHLLSDYRVVISYRKCECKEIEKVLPKAMLHKTYEEKKDALIKHSEAIINLIFGGVGTKKGVKLRKELLDVIKRPKDYLVLKPPSISSSKKRIKEYLLSLKLQGKSIPLQILCKC